MKKYDIDDNEELELLEKERDRDLFLKAGGLSSATIINEKHMNGYTIETHYHPELKEIIVVESWYVNGTDGDVMPEFEVKRSINSVREFIEYART
jgi:hypothetical protein